MDLIELLFIGLEAFFAGICWTFGGMFAESVYDRLFPPPPDDGDDEEPPEKKTTKPPPRKRKSRDFPFTVVPLLALLLLDGCASSGCVGCSTLVHEGKTVPGYDTEVICRLPDCKRWTPQTMQRALDMWVVAAGDTFDVNPQIPYLIIVEDTGDLGSSGTVVSTSGKTLDPFTIQIAGRYFQSIEYRPVGKSAFSHELCHVMLWSDPGDPDGNHAEPPGPWTEKHDEMIAEVDSALLRELE